MAVPCMVTQQAHIPNRAEANKRRMAFGLVLVLMGVPPSARAQDPSAPPSPPAALENMVNIRADHQAKAGEAYQLKGHVEVTYRQSKLTSDEASYEEATGEIVARGHVVFEDPQARLEADEAHYNVRSGKGWFTNGRGYVHTKVRTSTRMLKSENPFHIRGRRVERLDASTYRVEHGRLTSCEEEKTGWSITAHSAQLNVGDKLVSHGALVRLLDVPVFYSPFLVNSIGSEPRRAGFLLPQLGTSSQKGFTVGEGFFWPINPSADLLLGLFDYTSRGVGEVARFQARPTASSDLTANFFRVNDRGLATNPQVRAPGESVLAQGQISDLGHGFRGVVDVDYVSSLAFRQTFTDTFTEAVTSEDHITGFLTKNFGAHSLNFYASRYQDFLSTQNTPGNSVIISQTPSVSFSGMDDQVGHSPFYFSFETSGAGVTRTQSGFETPDISERLDFHPEVALRSQPIWGFHLTPTLGLRVTHYGVSLLPGGGSLNRVLGEFGLDLRPPSFEKLFTGTHWGYRFKHVIEPDIQYRLVRARDAQEIPDIIRFDETDVLTETDEIEFSLTNSLLVRKEGPESARDTPQARELISWRVSEKYYFDPTFGGAFHPGGRVTFEPTLSLTGFAFTPGHHLSPLVSVLKIAPSANYSTEIRADFDPNGRGVLNTGISSSLRRKLFSLAFTDFFINRTAVLPQPTSLVKLPPSFNLLNTVLTYGDVNRKGLSGAGGVAYNFAQGIALQTVSQVSYNFGCFALDFEYRRLALGILRRENQYRVAISLANVGTFGNLKPRERLY